MNYFQVELETYEISTLRQLLLMRDGMLYRTIMEGFVCFRYNLRRNNRSIDVETIRAMILETILDKLYDETMIRNYD